MYAINCNYIRVTVQSIQSVIMCRIFLCFKLRMQLDTNSGLTYNLPIIPPQILKQQVVLDSRHLKPPEMYNFFHSAYGERFMGTGLVSETNHEKWRIKRALMNPAFHRRYSPRRRLMIQNKYASPLRKICH